MGSLDTGDLQFGNARDRNSRTHDCSAPCVKLLGDPQQPAAIAIRHASPRGGRRRARTAEEQNAPLARMALTK